MKIIMKIDLGNSETVKCNNIQIIVVSEEEEEEEITGVRDFI